MDVIGDGFDSKVASAACHNSCLDPSLFGTINDRCAVWHQLKALGRTTGLPACVDFVHDDICGSTIRGLEVACDESGRVKAVIGHSAVTVGVATSEGSGSVPLGGECQVTWDGVLAPALGALERLKELDLSMPSRMVYVVANDSTVTLSDLVRSRECQRLTWMGNNLTGTVPTEWRRLRIDHVDLSGNQQLVGDLPHRWIDNSLGTIRVAGTGITGDLSCSLDCFNTSLTGPQRDRCALWYQARRLETREEWLPPCVPYVMSARNVCQREWEQTMGLTCNSEGRVTSLEIFPLFHDLQGFPVYPYFPELGGGGPCTAMLEGTLAPEVRALDCLNRLVAEAFPSVLYEDIWLGGRLRQTRLNCTEIVSWTGNNLTGTLPPEWGDLKNLRYISLWDQRQLGGQLPRSFVKIRTDVRLSQAYLHGTGVEVPPLTFLQMHRLCKDSQKRSSTLYINGPSKDYNFGVKMPRKWFSNAIYGQSSLSSSDVFYCGKNPEAEVQAGALWSCFIAMLVVLVCGRWWLWRRQQRRRAPFLLSQRPHHKFLAWAQRLSLMLFPLWVVYDIGSDLVLAYAMYPSWTAWVVLAGFSMPNVITAGAISHEGVEALRGHRRPWLALLLLPGLLVATMAVSPFLLLALSIPQAERNQKQWRFRSWWTWYWLGLDVQRVVGLYRGLTACTEDVMTSVFTTVGFVLMAKEPWKMEKVNIYFATWAFWISVSLAMVHMLCNWWVAVGHVLDHRSLSWAWDAFRRLHVAQGGCKEVAGAVSVSMVAVSGPNLPDCDSKNEVSMDEGPCMEMGLLSRMSNEEKLNSYLCCADVGVGGGPGRGLG